MKATLIVLTLFGLIGLSAGCRSSGEPLDLLSLTMTERASDVIDPESDTWRLGNDTVLSPGTLNFLMKTTNRFNIAGVPLPPQNENDFYSPKAVFMLYSDTVMDDLIAFVDAGTGGGQLRTIDMPTDGTMAERIAATGAVDRLIGLEVRYYGDAPFLADVTAEIIKKLGTGTPVPTHDDSQYWKVDDRYVLIFPAYDMITIFAANQITTGCLVVGGPGTVDLEDCDYDAFNAKFPANIRTRPAE